MRTGMLVLVALFGGCQEYNLKGEKDKVKEGEDTAPVDGDEELDIPEYCDIPNEDPQQIGVTDACFPDYTTGAFEPIEEWTLGQGRAAWSTVAVGDLNNDGMPEIVANVTGMLPGAKGDLEVHTGDGSGLVWKKTNADLAYASSPTLADLDDDGTPEILAVRKVSGGLLAGTYSVLCYDATGTLLWESDAYDNSDFDHATAMSVSDMDHDGLPEIVAGRIILNWDGSLRGAGAHGRGSWGGGLEASLSAVADLDLNGEEEVITGNAIYDADGNTLWHDPGLPDGMVGIANLDDDPGGEFVVSSNDTVRAMDTNGAVLWGPKNIPTANIVSPAAIADLDLDGYPEIVVAGGNNLIVYSHEGKKEWQAAVTDETGASGASVFDFEGDGWPEVVYIDEIEMIVFDGATGVQKFYSAKHNSATMMDYPVVADVDADGNAEIVVAHAGLPYAFSIYGDPYELWAPAREVWNQHPYSINNIKDNLRVPKNATMGFSEHNTWHSALDPDKIGIGEINDLEGEILDACAVCNADQNAFVWARVRNKSDKEAPKGIPVTLYDDDDNPLQTLETTKAIPSGETSDVLVFGPVSVDTESYWLEVDDDGTGTGVFEECDEDNNGFFFDGPFCD